MGATRSETETDMDASTEANESVYEPPEGISGAIRDSVLLKIAIGGGLFVLLSGFLDSGVLVSAGGLWSIWAAVFAAWGAGLVLTGLVGYGVLWWSRN
ncbi:hypothetical protein [Natrinema sp. 74]|uniref:hypothetical protein n=1 Tax=Natrinema sp. 74 TaxID=3384159 RepID=UPI0038D4DAE3